MLRVAETEYGGRAYFATKDIPQNTRILTDLPTVCAIFDDFKREVCLYCFLYERGATLKVRVGDSSRACSERCRDRFLQTVQGAEEIQHNWDLVQAGKQRKKLADDLYFDLLRFCVSAIPSARLPDSESCRELMALQDDYALTTATERESAKGVVQAMRHLFPETGLDHEVLVTSVMGRSKCNCFGIWQQEDGESFPESEMFGYCLYVRSSYFNHSCVPNVTKLRRGREMTFTTNRDISLGEELVISYLGDRVYKDGTARRDALKDWGFDCKCLLCTADLSPSSSGHTSVTF